MEETRILLLGILLLGKIKIVRDFWYFVRETLLEDRRSLEKFLKRRRWRLSSNSWEDWLKDFEETSNSSKPLSSLPSTSSHATNPKPIHLLPERERKREHDPRESRNYKLRGQIHPRIDQPVPKEKERKKGGANEACPEKRASIQPARGRCPRTSRSRACVRGYNGSTGHGEVSGCCPNGWEAYIGGGPRIGHSVVRGLIGRGIRWIS